MPARRSRHSVIRDNQARKRGLAGAGSACHAAVTAGAHDGHMLSGRRRDVRGRAGVLILRVWLEDRDDPELRVRMVGRPDLEGEDVDTSAAATVEETLAYVRDWLERFAASGQD